MDSRVNTKSVKRKCSLKTHVRFTRRFELERLTFTPGKEMTASYVMGDYWLMVFQVFLGKYPSNSSSASFD